MIETSPKYVKHLYLWNTSYMISVVYVNHIFVLIMQLFQTGCKQAAFSLNDQVPSTYVLHNYLKRFSYWSFLQRSPYKNGNWVIGTNVNRFYLMYCFIISWIWNFCFFNSHILKSYQAVYEQGKCLVPYYENQWICT